MTRRRGELDARTIDHDWPHQIALAADQVMGKSFDVIRDFCRTLSLCSRGHTVQRDNVTYNVFRFADPSHADLFRERLVANALIRRIAEIVKYQRAIDGARVSAIG